MTATKNLQNQQQNKQKSQVIKAASTLLKTTTSINIVISKELSLPFLSPTACIIFEEVSTLPVRK